MAESADSDTSLSLLKQLASMGLFGSIWPRGRLMLGQLVCKWVRASILEQVSSAKLVVRDINDVRSISKSLGKLHATPLSLTSHDKNTAPKLLQAMAEAAESDFGAALRGLDLSRAAAHNEQTVTPLKIDQLVLVLDKAAALTQLSLINGQILFGNGVEEGNTERKKFAQVLGQCKQLTHLNLSSNSLAESPDVLSSFPECHGLTELILADCMLSPEGMTNLAGSLQHCHALNLLDVSSNYISDEGAFALAEVMQKCCGISKLKLNSNNIGDRGAERLAREFKECKSLTVPHERWNVGMKNNSFSAIGAKKLRDALGPCKLDW